MEEVLVVAEQEGVGKIAAFFVFGVGKVIYNYKILLLFFLKKRNPLCKSFNNDFGLTIKMIYLLSD